MLPQLGTGSPTPSPRKDSVTSARMYCGTSSAAWVSSTPQRLRRDVAAHRYKSRAPKPRAART